MIELLYERVSFHKDKFISPILCHELNTLVKDTHGKVQAIAPNHDDQVFAYLHAIRVWYDGEDVTERYGIQKNVIRTDEDIEIDDNDIEHEDLEKINLEDATYIPGDYEDDILQPQLQYIKEASKAKLQSQYNADSFNKEQQQLQLQLALNKDFRDAYNKKYNIDPTSQVGTQFIDLPSDIFGSAYDSSDEDYMQHQKELNGNLGNIFRLL